MIYSTACGFSKKLFADTRALPNRPQLRWLTSAAEGYGAEGVVSQRTASSIAGAFAKKYTPPADAAAAARAIAINEALAFALPSTRRITYPTVIYKTQQGLKVHYGAPANLGKLATAVEPRPERANHVPAGVAWSGSPPTMTSVAKLQKYSPAGEAPIYLAPVPQAPVIRSISKEYLYPVSGVANGEWLKITLSTVAGKPVHGYVQAPREIRLASLTYTVLPMRGLFRSGKRTLDVREHPSPEANVMEVIEPGIQMTKTGEVTLDGRKWSEVLVYTDGTKGYIAE